MTETWLPVPGYEGIYEVSDLGRVRSLDRIDRCGRQLYGRVLKLRNDKDGYQQFHAGGSPRRILRVHRLVLLAFTGAPAGVSTECLHIDGNPANNRLANLRWGTVSENIADQIRHGTHRNSSKTHCPSGHAYDEANTYIHPVTGWRACRACARERARIRSSSYNQKAA